LSNEENFRLLVDIFEANYEKMLEPDTFFSDTY